MPATESCRCPRHRAPATIEDKKMRSQRRSPLAYRRKVESNGISLLSLVLLLTFFGLSGRASAQCSNPANAIVAENCLPGSPSSEWNVSLSGDATIQGFATDISVN